MHLRVDEAKCLDDQSSNDWGRIVMSFFGGGEGEKGIEACVDEECWKARVQWYTVHVPLVRME